MKKSVAKVEALLGKFSNLLYFMEEGGSVYVKPKQLLSKESFEALRSRVEDIGGRYVNLSMGFEIPKATLEKSVEEPVKTVSEKPNETATLVEPMREDKYRRIPLPLVFWKTPVRGFTREDVENMGVSLRVHGQIQPIVVKPENSEGLYEGVCGRLRYEGAKHAHIPEILVRIHSFKGEDEVLEWQLVENLHRKELTTLQRAKVYKQLYDLRRKELGGVKDKSVVKGIAESIERLTGEKKAEQTIRQYIQVDKELPDKVKSKIRVNPNFGVEHARQLLRLKDKPEAQLELTEKFLEKPMTVKKLKKQVDETLNPQPIKVRKEVDTGDVWECPICQKRFRLIHVEPANKHKLEESPK